MEELVSILLLWVGFGLMLWALARGLDEVEASLESNAQRPQRLRPRQFAHPVCLSDAVGDVVGNYLGAPIYRKVTIGGVDYYFDHIQAPEDTTALRPNERWLKPGIVYMSARV